MTPSPKNRHGCLTTWLILMVIGNSMTVVSTLILFSTFAKQGIQGFPVWVLPVFIILALFNLICTVALFKWKKWGFWAFCASAFIATFLNLFVVGTVAGVISGILGIAFLYGVLQIGKENSGWSQLE